MSRALWASNRPSQRVSLQLDVDTSDNISTCSRLPHFVREGSPASLIPMVSFQHPNSRHNPHDSMVQFFLLSYTLPSLHVLMSARTNVLVSCFRLSMLCSLGATVSRTPISCFQIINRLWPSLILFTLSFSGLIVRRDEVETFRVRTHLFLHVCRCLFVGGEVFRDWTLQCRILSDALFHASCS